MSVPTANHDLETLHCQVGFIVIQWGHCEQALELLTNVLFQYHGGKRFAPANVGWGERSEPNTSVVVAVAVAVQIPVEQAEHRNRSRWVSLDRDRARARASSFARRR